MTVELGKNLITGTEALRITGNPALCRIYTASNGTSYTLGNPSKPESRNQTGSDVKLLGYDPNALGAYCYYLA